MSDNPFLAPADAVEHEDCQRIHYQAVRAAVRGIRPESIPASLPLAALVECARLDGAEVYLLHQTDIERLFAGVTLPIYQAARTLYCSRLGRSIKMVWRILRALAEAAGAAVLSYEAVWALCLYLEEPRRASVGVHIERGQDTWWIGQTTPDISIQEHSAAHYQPAIIWCVDMRDAHVLAFRIAPQEESACDRAALVLYDAITAHRRPNPRAVTGLLWHLPKRIITTIPFSQPCLAACGRGGIQAEQTGVEPPSIQAIRDTWERGMAGRTLHGAHCAALLDAYLNRVQGFGPLREREQRARAYSSLIGYNRDPAAQFPLLREFLPGATSAVAVDGTVPYNGLHYTHELLSYWPGSPVSIRRSAHMEVAAWIYLDGEILCQAYARELRRRDGSYRQFR